MHGKKRLYRSKEAVKSFQTSRSLSRPHTAWFNPESVFVTGGCGEQMVERSSAAHYCGARLLGAFATSAPVAHSCPAGCLPGACLLSHRTRRQHYPLYYILTRIDFCAEGQRCTKSSGVQQLTLVTTDRLTGGAVLEESFWFVFWNLYCVGSLSAGCFYFPSAAS